MLRCVFAFIRLSSPSLSLSLSIYLWLSPSCFALLFLLSVFIHLGFAIYFDRQSLFMPFDSVGCFMAATTAGSLHISRS